MKKIFKKLMGVSLAGALALGVASCSSDEDTTSTNIKTSLLYGAEITDVDSSNVTLVNPGKLTVGMSTDFAPSEFIDSTKTGQDQFVGSDVSFCQALAKALGVELEIKAMSFDLILSALDTDLIDVAVSGFAYTPTRAASYTPTICYYNEGDDGQVVVVKSEDAEKYSTLESLNSADIKIAVQTNSLQELLVTEQIPNAERITVGNIDDSVEKLKAGAFDAMALAGGNADILIEQSGGAITKVGKLDDTGYTGNFAWVKKGNDTLKEALDLVITEVVENNYYKMWVEQAEALVLNLGDKAEEIIPE